MNRAALEVAFGVRVDREHTPILHEAVMELLLEAAPVSAQARYRIRGGIGQAALKTVLDVQDRGFFCEVYQDSLEITSEEDHSSQIRLPLADPDLVAQAWQFLLSV